MPAAAFNRMHICAAVWCSLLSGAATREWRLAAAVLARAHTHTGPYNFLSIFGQSRRAGALKQPIIINSVRTLGLPPLRARARAAVS